MNPADALEALPPGSVIAWATDYVAIKNWDGYWELVGPPSESRELEYGSPSMADILADAPYSVLRTGR